ncbi:MAG: ABC transporter permease [Spirochaetales bacterium]|nr:ABC transporter permease [Spirochaetales bacterium]
MKILLKIAVRNLFEHKVKTLIIGIIIASGVFILVTVNSMLDTSKKGIRENFIENYTGHLMIHGKTTGRASLFPQGGGMDGESKKTPTIESFFDVVEFLENSPQVKAFSPQISGSARVSVEESDMGFSILFGIDPEKYKEMYPQNINIIEGEYLDSNEEGILLSKSVVNMLKRFSKREVHAGDKILLTGMSFTAGTKIREVTVKGIMEFKNSQGQLQFVSLVSVDTMRALEGLTVGANMEVELSQEDTELMDMSIDDMFSDTGLGNLSLDNSTSNTSDIFNILGDSSESKALSETDSGAWYYIAVRLEPGASIEGFRKSIQNWFDEQGLENSTADWLQGAGSTAQASQNFQWVFNVVIIMIAIVAIIIIMNTLVISITERIPEIGTIRAIGGQKSFIRWMILLETFLISIVFGTIGIIAATIALNVTGAIGIEAPNMFFEVILGGKVLYPVISISALIAGLISVILISLIACIYPLVLALRIQPVTAMQSK